jgi:hypothetical protein
MSKQWCIQCGREGRALEAAGVDAEGEPACTYHRQQGGEVVDKRLCKCGCGTELKATTKYTYIRGHRPHPSKRTTIKTNGHATPTASSPNTAHYERVIADLEVHKARLEKGIDALKYLLERQ